MPVPQILKEVVEVVKAVKNVPQERISGRISEQIDGDLVSQRVDLVLDDFVTLLTNSGIPVSPVGIWDVIDVVVPKDDTCISWTQQVQVVTILDRHVTCRSDSASCASWWCLLFNYDCYLHPRFRGLLCGCLDREREGSSSVAAHQFPFCSVILEATPQLGIALRKSGGERHTRRPAVEMMDPGNELGRSR